MRMFKEKINSEIHTKDLMGQTFGRLTVIEKSDSYVSPDGHKQVKWICKCQCGNVVEVHSTSLVNKRTLSCGCLAKENAEKWKLKGLDDCYDDTRISLLNDTIYSKNTSGIRGVTYAKDKQKWEAQIEFKKKKIHLGYFNDKEMAAKVRKYAEERLWQPLLSDYKINAAIEDVQKYIKINYKK